MSVSGWVSAKLAEVTTKVGSGATPKGGKESYHSVGVPLIRSLNIHFESFLYDGLAFLDEGQARELANVTVRAGDVLLNITGASIGRVNQCPIDLDGSRVNQHVCIIRPCPELDPAFLRHYLASPQQQDLIFQMETGVTRQALTKEMILNFILPIPPIQEQRRIVAKIEELFSELDAGVAALERVRAGLKRYRAAVLKAAVEGKLTEDWRARHPDTEPATVLLERILTERRRKWEETQLAKFAQAAKEPLTGWQAKYQGPEKFQQLRVDLPYGWCWATWEQLSTRVTVGHVGPMKHEYVEVGVPFLRSQNIRENRFSNDGLLYITEGFHRRLSKSMVRPRDLAVVRSGSVGVTCVIPDWLGEANCSDLVLIQGLIGVLAEYGSYYMNSTARRLVKAGSVGIALTHFNTRSVAALPVPLPPFDEQQEIVADVDRRLSVVDEIETQVEADLKRASRLRQAILKRAFEGRLVPQDPTDEPADQLLARIRQQRQASSASKDGKPATRRRGRPRKADTALPLFTEDDGADEGGEP